MRQIETRRNNGIPVTFIESGVVGMFFMRSRIGVASFFVVWLVYAAFLEASQVDKAEVEGSSTSNAPRQTQPLQLESLIPELVKFNPELQAARKRYEAAQKRPIQQSALPDPRVTMGWISNGYPYPGAGLGTEPTSNIGFQFAQEFPYPGKRSLLGGVAQKEADSEAQTVQARELDLIAQLKERYYELRLAYESIDLLRKNQALLQQLAKVAEARYSVGKGIQQDLIKAGIEVSILENRLILLEQKRGSLSAAINTLLGRNPESELGRPESLSTVPALEPLEALQGRALQSSPILQAQQSMIDSRQLNVQSAQKAYYPDFDVMSGYYNQGALKPMWEFKVQVNVPIYFWKKQRPGLEEAGVRLSEAQRTYRSQEQVIRFQLRDRYLAAQASRRLMDLYSKQIVPQSQLALESSLASYETGNLDFLSVLSNFNTIRDSQISYFEQQAEYLKALSRLEELAGSVTNGATPSRDSQNGEVHQ
jgi:outer membrane protein, heavy metal efflux system